MTWIEDVARLKKTKEKLKWSVLRARNLCYNKYHFHEIPNFKVKMKLWNIWNIRLPRYVFPLWIYFIGGVFFAEIYKKHRDLRLVILLHSFSDFLICWKPLWIFIYNFIYWHFLVWQSYCSSSKSFKSSVLQNFFSPLENCDTMKRKYFNES